MSESSQKVKEPEPAPAIENPDDSEEKKRQSKLSRKSKEPEPALATEKTHQSEEKTRQSKVSYKEKEPEPGAATEKTHQSEEKTRQSKVSYKEKEPEPGAATENKHESEEKQRESKLSQKAKEPETALATEKKHESEEKNRESKLSLKTKELEPAPETEHKHKSEEKNRESKLVERKSGADKSSELLVDTSSLKEELIKPDDASEAKLSQKIAPQLIRTERIPIKALFGKSYKPDGGTEKKKQKDKKTRRGRSKSPKKKSPRKKSPRKKSQRRRSRSKSSLSKKLSSRKSPSKKPSDKKPPIKSQPSKMPPRKISVRQRSPKERLSSKRSPRESTPSKMSMRKRSRSPSKHKSRRRRTPDSDKRKWDETLSKVVKHTMVRELTVRPNKYTENLVTRSIKMTKDMERPFLVVEDNVNYTPNRVIQPGDRRWLRNPLIFTFPCENVMKYKPEDLIRNFGKSSTKATLDLGKNPSQTKNISDDQLATTATSGDELETYSTVAPSMYYLVYPEPEKINKRKISFNLSETDIIILLDIKSQASEIGDEEGLAIKTDNDYQMELKRRLRKTIESYSQTSMGSDPNRVKETYISRRPRVNSSCFTSNWVFHDEMEAVKIKPKPIPPKRLVDKVDKIVYAESKSVYEPLIGSNFIIYNRLNWFRAAMIMERLLLSTNAYDRQLVFYDHLLSDPMSIEVDFKYNLKLLWTLKSNKSKGTAVTSMSWHYYLTNLLAVGYGKYSFSSKQKGIVAIWNLKNLANPEREYYFPHSVTCVRFSKLCPAILAIGFYSGMVMVINIIRQHDTKVVAQNILSDYTLVSPVWQVTWIRAEITLAEQKSERLIECRGDGSVYKYTRGHLYEKKRIMMVAKMKGLVRGIPQIKKPHPYVIPLVRHPAILCLALHPSNPNVYYIGSDEGAVYKCSFQDVNQHSDMFLAHNGPVYTIQFHPACSKIFLTCGADWYIRVWAESIFIPLLTMISGMSAVQSATWCPNSPTLIAGITTTRIEIWDISRKINLPQATVENPYGFLNTSMKFSRCGNNLCVGDEDGNVFTYGLCDMPFSPANQDLVLALALLKALVPKPKLLTELVRLGEPFTVQRLYKNLIQVN